MYFLLKRKGRGNIFSIITCTNKIAFIDNIFRNYESQKFNEKELIIILNEDNIDNSVYVNRSELFCNVSIYQLNGKTSLGECLNFGVKKAKYPYIAKFDDDDYYGPYYLMEAYDAIKRTNAEVIGKHSIFIYFKDKNNLCKFNQRFENSFITSRYAVMGSTLVIKKSLLKQINFPSVNVGEDYGFQQLCKKNGIPIYSTSAYNYVYFRYNTVEHHTSDVSPNRLQRRCKHIMTTDNYKGYVDKEFYKK